MTTSQAAPSAAPQPVCHYRLTMPIVPDDKDWTWVLTEPCNDCGFVAAEVPFAEVSERVRENAAAWPALLARPDAALRPTGDQWSALEYACHVRDVFRLYEHRLGLMLAEDDPLFANWNQDDTAVAERYDLQDRSVVSAELLAAGESIAARFAEVTPDQLHRRGRRSDGAAFTIDTFARYFLHDPVHHLDDVRRGNVTLANSQLD